MKRLTKEAIFYMVFKFGPATLATGYSALQVDRGVSPQVLLKTFIVCVFCLLAFFAIERRYASLNPNIALEKKERTSLVEYLIVLQCLTCPLAWLLSFGRF